MPWRAGESAGKHPSTVERPRAGIRGGASSGLNPRLLCHRPHAGFRRE
jgi:hypothetical protein